MVVEPPLQRADLGLGTLELGLHRAVGALELALGLLAPGSLQRALRLGRPPALLRPRHPSVRLGLGCDRRLLARRLDLKPHRGHVGSQLLLLRLRGPQRRRREQPRRRRLPQRTLRLSQRLRRPCGVRQMLRRRLVVTHHQRRRAPRVEGAQQVAQARVRRVAPHLVAPAAQLNLEHLVGQHPQLRVAPLGGGRVLGRVGEHAPPGVPHEARGRRRRRQDAVLLLVVQRLCQLAPHVNLHGVGRGRGGGGSGGGRSDRLLDQCVGVPSSSSSSAAAAAATAVAAAAAATAGGHEGAGGGQPRGCRVGRRGVDV